MNTTIAQILTLPDGCPLESVSGRLTKVFKLRSMNGQFGPTTVQEGVLQETSGAEITVSAWGHADFSIYQGKDLILRSNGSGKGLKVVHSSYIPTGKTEADRVNKIKLELSRQGVFQPLDGSSLAAPTTQPAKEAAKAVETAGKAAVAPIRGDKVGMAINNAGLMVSREIEAGVDYSDEDKLFKRLAKLTSRIIRMSNWFEQGNLLPDEDLK